MILLSHPTGNQNSRAVLRALAQEELLFEFHTSFATYENTWMKKHFFPSLNRRQFDAALKNQIKTYPYFEFTQRLLNHLKLSWLVPREGAKLSMYETAQYMDWKIANRIKGLHHNQIKAVYAYENMAIRSFEAARQKELNCLYELPIGYWKAYKELLSSEQEKWPLWAPTLKGFKNSEQKLKQKDMELEMADHIFVASQFTADTLKLFPRPLKAPVHIINYGFPKVDQAMEQRRYDFHRSHRPLKLLFIGGLSQRKGLSYLFEATAAFGSQVQLTVVGKKVVENCRVLDEALKKCHQWIPSLPHSKILELMHENDVLVFPSLFEGFGLVITEAMSQGTPVIATERTAAPDLITDGADSLLVKAGSTEDLILKIESLLSRPESIERMGKAALRTAQKRPWEVYGRELSQTIKEAMSSNTTTVC